MLEIKKPFNMDDLLGPLGGFGKFQVINLIHISFIIVLTGITEIAYVFTAGQLEHRCLIPECESLNSSYSQPWLSSAIPRINDEKYAMCKRFNTNFTQHSTCSNSSFTRSQIPCSIFVYDTEEWTIAREDWGTQCEEDRWMLTSIGSYNNLGVVVGSLFVGFLCDRYGRKAVIVSMSIVVATLGTIKSFSINYAMFAAFEFIEATMTGGLFTLPFVLALEIVDPAKRVHAGACVTCAYSLGEIIVGFTQYMTLDWRLTLRIVRIPFLIIISFYWTLPESVRWLITKRRNSEALDVLQLIAKRNGSVLSKDAVSKVLEHAAPTMTETPGAGANQFKTLLQSKIMRLRFLATISVWVANSFIFFGMNLNSVSINDDKFLNSILTSLIEMPAYLSIIILLNRLGRRKTQSLSLLLCSASCLVFAFVPDVYWVHLTLFLVGKFGIAISFITVDVYTTELFPTPVRASAISTGHMVGRVAAVLAPQTPLLEVYYDKLPLLLFSIFAAIGGSLAATLPETANIKLPDTLEEAEQLGRQKKEKDTNTERF